MKSSGCSRRKLSAHGAGGVWRKLAKPTFMTFLIPSLRAAVRSPRNRTLSWLRRLCGWAVERDLITVNPCAGVRPPTPETARDRILSDDELKAVWQASGELGQPYAEFIRLLILTGARRNEIAEMTWKEIDLEARIWSLPKERSKNEREHTVPLSDSAILILTGLPRVSDLIFSLNGRNRITAFHLTKRRIDAAMPPDTPAWTLHDLRRTFASGCARMGVAVHIVEAALNHKSGTIKGVAAVYNRYSYDAEKRGALEAWSRYVEALVSGDPAGNVIPLMRGMG